MMSARAVVAIAFMVIGYWLAWSSSAYRPAFVVGILMVVAGVAIVIVEAATGLVLAWSATFGRLL